jgi:hypothetical protein
LKYAGATGAVLGASALGLDYVLSPQPGPMNQSATLLGQTTRTSRTNHPPIANFMRKPFYLNPTDQQTIQFMSSCYDADNDPLQYSWSIDGKPVSTQNDYTTQLPVGEHYIKLKVSDGVAENSVEQRMTVEPDQIYPTKKLHIKHKGMRMTVGWKGMPHTPTDITDEKLDTIRNELECNAVIIYGNTEFEDDLIEAGRLAIGKGFDRIYVAPMYLDLPFDQTIYKIGQFAKRIRVLRQLSEAIVFMVGHEFSLDAFGIIPGETYSDRTIYIREHTDAITRSYAVLPGMFRKIVELCKDNYGYQIAYAATAWEAEDIVPWENPIFESVSSDAYIMKKVGWTDDVVRNHLLGLKRFGKPVNSTEWGCPTYKGAGYQAASDFLDEDLAKYPYDEDEQANYIAQYCSVLNGARISGAFYTQIDDERPKGYGLYKIGYGGASRKKGFYMYKSYQRTA